MKKSLSFCLALSLTSLQAQDTLKLYFDSGKSNLTKASRHELDQLIEQTALIKDYDIDLKAYTDDIGSICYNKALSNDRATEVWNYLQAAAINPNSKKISGLGELALKSSKSIKEQRRQNRRVDVILNKFEPQSTEEAYGYLSSRDEESFSITPLKAQTLIGREGTVVHIPANTFCTEEGKAPKTVDIILKEAYTFGDMISHRLTTTSNGQILETGGMIYLEARDENGEKLKVQEGRELLVKMPSHKELKEDMQLFLSDRDGEEFGERSNWTATNQLFNRTAATPVLRDRKIPNGKKKFLIKEAHFDLADLPSFRAFPVHPKKPVLHEFKAKPTNKQKLEKQYPKKWNESSKAYQQRINKLCKQSDREYQLAREHYQLAQSNYEKELLTYNKAMQVYNDQARLYTVYLAELDQKSLQLDKMLQNLQDIKQQYKNIGNIYGPVATVFTNMNKYKETLSQNCKDLDFEKIYQDLVSSKRLTMPQKVVRLINETKNLSRTFHNALGANNFIHKSKVVNQYYHFAKGDDYSYSRYHIGKFASSFPMINSSLERKDFNTCIQQFYRNYQYIQECTETLAFLQSFAPQNNALIEQLYSEEIQAIAQEHKKIILQEYYRIMDQKIEQGLMARVDDKTMLMNSITISGLGWVNCDRFTSFPKEQLIRPELSCLSKSKVDFFIVLPEYNSVISLERIAADRYSSDYSGIPKDAQIQLIALNVKEKESWLYQYSGQAKDLKNIHVQLEKVNVKTLRNVLAKL